MTRARRAERDELDLLLDRMLARDTLPPVGDALAELVVAGIRVHEGLRAAVAPECARGHLAALAGALPASTIVEPVSPRVPLDRSSVGVAAWPFGVLAAARPRRAMSLAMAGIMLLSVSLAGTARASHDTVPGELLYPVKRVVEVLSLGTRGDPVSRARLHLDLARRRRAEIRALRAGNGAPGRVAEAASGVRAALSEARRELGIAASLGRDLGDVPALLRRAEAAALAAASGVARPATLSTPGAGALAVPSGAGPSVSQGRSSAVGRARGSDAAFRRSPGQRRSGRAGVSAHRRGRRGGWHAGHFRRAGRAPRAHRGTHGAAREGANRR